MSQTDKTTHQSLVFFDRGSNTHVIKGSLAIKEGLQCISDKPTALSVVGGSKVRTEYGMYQFNLGPTENREYHELTCIGMNNVIAKFRIYTLDGFLRSS